MKGAFQTGKKTLIATEGDLMTGTGTRQKMDSEVQWTLRKGIIGVQVIAITTHVEGALWRGVVVTMTGVHLRKNIDTGVLLTKTNILRREKKVTGVHLRKNVDTGVLLTKTNILGREKKEMNGLKGGKNIVTIHLTRTKLYNSLLSPFCCAFVLVYGICMGEMGMQSGNPQRFLNKHETGACIGSIIIMLRFIFL